MSTPAAPSSPTAKVTTDTKLARLFGLQGEGWLLRQAWFVNRLVLLFEDVKPDNSDASWEC